MEPVYVGYGIGYYYSVAGSKVKEKIKLSYLCDRKWEGLDCVLYDSIPVISKTHLAELKSAKAVIFSNSPVVKASIAEDLRNIGVEYIFADELIGDERYLLTGTQIKTEGVDGIWEDHRGNRIYYDETLPDDVILHIRGAGSSVRFGRNMTVARLTIWLGNHAECEIGSNTTIVNVRIWVAYAAVRIGKDCLFASEVIIRTNDAHHIFDKDSHMRLNPPKDVVIYNHVWVCVGAYLLPGAEIGEGSVVGANAVTSGKFEDHVILAGVPAKVIRRNICWSKDDTELENHRRLEECMHQEALKYL